MKRILVVDDERPLRQVLVRFIRSLDMEVDAVASGNEAMERLDGLDLLISDVRMPGMDGMTLLGEVRKRRPELPVVMLTGHGTIALAVEAMRAGAANFLTKPFELEEIETAVRAALGAPARVAPPSHDDRAAADAVVGASPPIRHLLGVVQRVAGSEATVMVTGESGSGKEVVARAIHAASRRAQKPFVAVNCGAIPEALLESELFGHVKGAFTGAVQNRVGRFGAAEGGTLLLDEIGELPLHLQVKLLRVLQERSYTPVGETYARAADVRVIAATHRDLEAMVAAGTFREDLYYRLNVLHVPVPPLRDRGEDILVLAQMFLARAAAAEGRADLKLDDDVVACLKKYPWPGNVRELEHAMTRAAVLAHSTTLTLADLPIKVRGVFSQTVATAAPMPAPSPVVEAIAESGLPDEGVDLNATLEHVERRLVVSALERTGGNRNRAAALLKIRRTTLVEKLKRLGVGAEN